jgi:hypothetical protein
MQMGGWCVATIRIEVTQTVGLTRSGRVGGAYPGGGRGARWLAEAKRSEWEGRGSSGWGGMVMEAPSFVRISRPRSGAGQNGMIRKVYKYYTSSRARKGQSFIWAEGRAINSHNRD